MLKTRFAALLAALIFGLVSSSIAGTISLGTVSHDTKTNSVDLQHENMAVPQLQEDDFCVELGISGDVFVDGIGDPDNSTHAVDLAALSASLGPIVITDVGWDVTIDPIGASWYSESSFALTSDTDPSGVQPITLAPGTGEDFANDGSPHNYNSGGLVNLIAAIGENIVATDGIINIELFESFDDVADEADANLLAGSSITFGFRDALTFTEHTAVVKWVPEPASMTLLGLAGLALFGMRRRS